jgi:AN1-type zinc finger protein 4
MDTSKKCTFCSKKIGIVNTYNCKCSKAFCTSHRMPESHQCTYMEQFKIDGRRQLESQLTKVVAEKIISC